MKATSTVWLAMIAVAVALTSCVSPQAIPAPCSDGCAPETVVPDGGCTTCDLPARTDDDSGPDLGPEVRSEQTATDNDGPINELPGPGDQGGDADARAEQTADFQDPPGISAPHDLEPDRFPDGVDAEADSGPTLPDSADVAATDAPPPADALPIPCLGDEDCDDRNPCTANRCVPELGCQFPIIDAECEDGNLCTVADRCHAGQCQSGTALLCIDDNPCTDDQCQPDFGCVFAPNFADCDDQNVCTVGDACHEGACRPGAALACRDDNPCTIEACDPQSGCQSAVGVGLPCDDGDPCTAQDLCQQTGECVGSGSVSCEDDNPCSDDFCQPGLGCQHEDHAGMCDDGNPCTFDDQCLLGSCVSGQNFCQCQQDSDCIAAEDGDLCNGTLICLEHGCQVDPDTVVTCASDEQTDCNEYRCLPETGQCVWQTAPDGAECNDGDACTLQDSCADGVCSGQPLVCFDDNECTDDTCDPSSGCEFLPNILDCDDLDACTSADICDAGQCHGQPVSCADLSVCTADVCDTQSGACGHDPVAPIGQSGIGFLLEDTNPHSALYQTLVDPFSPALDQVRVIAFHTCG